jgi:hypothetical protein
MFFFALGDIFLFCLINGIAHQALSQALMDCDEDI